MKTVISTCLIVSLIISAAQAQMYSKEEHAIINTLQQHYNHFQNRDYESLAAMWVHEPYAGHLWISPNNVSDERGWEQISEAARNNFEFNTIQAPDVDYSKFAYTFHIRGNMALVNFVGENDVRTTAILEKINGTWKYVHNNQIDQPAFEMSAKLRGLRSYTGKWRMVPDSFKWENPQTKGALLSYFFDIQRTPKGLEMNGKFRFINPQEVVVNGTEEFVLNANSPNREWVHTRTNYFVNNGWSSSSAGAADISDTSIELSGTVIGQESNSYVVHLQLDSDDHLEISTTYGSGAKWSVLLEQVE